MHLGVEHRTEWIRIAGTCLARRLLNGREQNECVILLKRAPRQCFADYVLKNNDGFVLRRFDATAHWGRVYLARRADDLVGGASPLAVRQRVQAMQFFEIVEGKSGEELTSAVLKFLLINSSTMRERFVERLRHKLPASRAPQFRDGIICQNEVALVDNDESGRIDLLIREESGMVIGLENKFWAQFTPNQPAKYWPGLVAKAGAEASCRIVVLVPELRKEEVEIHIRSQQLTDKCIVLFWDHLRTDLAEIMRRDRSEVAAVAFFLDEYVKKQVLEVQINISRPQVVGPNVTIGNDFHYELLYKLKTCLPNAERITPAKSWIGVHFAVDPSVSIKQWIGFLRTDDPLATVVFGIHTGIPRFDPPKMASARLAKGFGNAAFVEIDFDESLKSTPAWKHRLEELLVPLKGAVGAYGASQPQNTESPGK